MNMNLFGYCIVIFITFCFTYIFDSPESKFLFYVVILLPLIDLMSLLFIKTKIDINMEVPNDDINKKDIFNVKITVRNKGILPVTNLQLFVNYKKNEYIQRISVGSREYRTVYVKIVSEHIGKDIINLDRFEASGIFNIFKRRVNILKSKEVVTLPRILSIINFNQNFEAYEKSNEYKSICEKNLDTYEDLDSDYKLYNMGESLSRINWKLYSKSNELFTRKSINYMSQKNAYIILDTRIFNDKDRLLKYDALVETFVSMVKYFYELSGRIDVFIFYLSEPKSLTITSLNDIKLLKSELASFDITFKEDSSSNEYSIIDYSNIKSKQNFYTIVITTNNPDKYQNIFPNCIMNIIYLNKQKIHANKYNNINIYSSKIIDNKCIIERHRDV